MGNRGDWLERVAAQHISVWILTHELFLFSLQIFANPIFGLVCRVLRGSLRGSVKLQASHNVKSRLGVSICQRLHCSVSIKKNLHKLNVVESLALELLHFQAAAVIQD